MSLRRDRGILSKLTGNKKKSLFDWKILDKSKYEQNDGSKLFKELKIGPAKRTKSKNIKKEENHQKIKGNMFETIFNGNLINFSFILNSIYYFYFLLNSKTDSWT